MWVDKMRESEMDFLLIIWIELETERGILIKISLTIDW